MKLNISDLLINTFKNFRKNFFHFFLFELLYKILMNFMFIPFIIFLFHILIKISGNSPLTNRNLFRFLFSFKGFAVIIIISVLSLIIIFIEVGTLIILSEQSYLDKMPSIFNTLIITMHKATQVISIGTIPLILFMLFLVPFNGLFLNPSIFQVIQSPNFIINQIENYSIYTSIFQILQIPIFIANEIDTSYIFTGIYFLLALFLFIILIKCIFTIHCIIIENFKISKALKKSIKLTKGVNVNIIFALLICNILIFILLFGIVLLLIGILSLINVVFKLSMNKNNILEILITLYSIFTFLYCSFLAMPFNIVLLTKIYHLQSKKLEDNIEIKFNKKTIQDLTLKNKIYSYCEIHKKKYILITIVIFLISSLLNNSASYNSISPKKNVNVISHRGNCINEPENSISAIKNSINTNVDYAEIDVQETKEGNVVLMHDYNLKRLTGVDKTVKQLTLTEIQNLDIGNIFDSKYKGEKIPTLNEAIKNCKGKTKLLIELKTHENGDSLAKKVVTIIENNDFANECAIHSLDYDCLVQVKKLNSKISTGFIIYIATGDITDFNVDFYTIEQTIITDDLVSKIHKKNKKIYAWTINEAEYMREMLSLNVDGIITDHPNELKKIIENCKATN